MIMSSARRLPPLASPGEEQEEDDEACAEEAGQEGEAGRAADGVGAAFSEAQPV